ncbi:phosphocarrier protein HPr domain protein [Enterococcus lactis]|uniref:phosphocarrier protein HPr domain protein n=1 Tax=Enterococcus lactis TaxID=357441 RepID=UPI001FD623BD|nr:phosphocarrier protein HPr domain protein [Enterococcus lactis]
MIGLTIFWCVIGVIVATLGILLISANEENMGSGSLIGTILLITGILIAAIACYSSI